MVLRTARNDGLEAREGASLVSQGREEGSEKGEKEVS